MACPVFSNGKIFSLLLVARSIRHIGHFDSCKGVQNSSLVCLTMMDRDEKGDRWDFFNLTLNKSPEH